MSSSRSASRAVLLAALLSVPAACPAAVLVTETFSYANGPLETVASGTWSYVVGTTAGAVITPSVNVSEGRLAFSYQAATSLLDGYYAIGLGAAQTGTLYYAFDLTIVDEPDSSTGGTSLAQFLPAAVNAPSTRGRMWLGGAGGGSSNAATAAVTNGSGTAADRDFYPSNVAEGSTVRVVVKWDPVAVTTTLWLSPTSEASTSITADDVSNAPGGGMTHFAFRNRGNIVMDDFLIDNLVVATTFGEVLAIPEPGEIGAVLGALALGVVALRRRHRA